MRTNQLSLTCCRFPLIIKNAQGQDEILEPEEAFWYHSGRYTVDQKKQMRRSIDVIEILDQFAIQLKFKWRALPNCHATCKALRAGHGRGKTHYYEKEDMPWIWCMIQRNIEESKSARLKAMESAADILRLERYNRYKY